MEDFVYQNATKIIFGKGVESQVGKETALWSKKVLLHFGSGSIRDLPEEGHRLIPIALERPTDYDARAEVMWAGTVAHNDLLSTGRVGDWASHYIEHELSAFYDVAHGAGLAVVFPAWMKQVYKNDLARFTQFAHRVWDVEYDFGSPERTALEGIRRLQGFFKSIGLPTTLKELGIPGDRLEEMAKRSTAKGPLGNFAKLGAAEVLNVYKLAS
jgi:alcohol dehydrogenase YqhD (iron-dependent ADH family)